MAADTSLAVLNGERLLGLSAAARQIPGYRANGHLNPSTILRWITTGAKAADGTRVKLEAVRLGNRWLTSVESLARFSAACSSLRMVHDPPHAKSGSRILASAAAKELDSLGIR